MSKINVSVTRKEIDALMAGAGAMVYLGFQPNKGAIIAIGNAHHQCLQPGVTQSALELTVEELGFTFAAAQCLHAGQETGQIKGSPHALEDLAKLAQRLSGYLIKATESMS